jgi:hypothetical protein
VRDDGDREAILALARRADVIVENREEILRDWLG